MCDQEDFSRIKIFPNKQIKTALGDSKYSCLHGLAYELQSQWHTAKKYHRISAGHIIPTRNEGYKAERATIIQVLLGSKQTRPDGALASGYYRFHQL